MANTPKMIWGVIGLIITLIILSGALSGNFVLRGTNSSSALVVVMLLFLIWDISYIYRAYNDGATKSQPAVKETKNDNVVLPAVEPKTSSGVGVACGKTDMEFKKYSVTSQNQTIDANFAKN